MQEQKTATQCTEVTERTERTARTMINVETHDNKDTDNENIRYLSLYIIYDG